MVSEVHNNLRTKRFQPLAIHETKDDFISIENCSEIVSDKAKLDNTKIGDKLTNSKLTQV